MESIRAGYGLVVTTRGNGHRPLSPESEPTPEVESFQVNREPDASWSACPHGGSPREFGRLVETEGERADREIEWTR